MVACYWSRLVVQENTYLEVLFVVFCMSSHLLVDSYHLDTYRGIPSWAETENRFSGNDQHLSSVLSGDKSLSSQLSNQRSWTRQLKRLEKSMNHCKKTASIEWTLSTQRTGRHLRNSQWEERSFSEPRTYLRAGWHRIDRIKKLSSVLID